MEGRFKGVRLDGGPAEFRQDVAEVFSESVSPLVDVYFRRAIVEAVAGFKKCAIADVLFAIDVAEAIELDNRLPLYGFAIDLHAETGAEVKARHLLKRAWELLETECPEDRTMIDSLNELEDLLGGEEWKDGVERL